MEKNAVIIETTGEKTVVSFTEENGLSVLQKAVGGYVQAIDLGNDLTLWVNEEGKLESLPHNPIAQQYFDLRFGAGADYIVGNAVLTGGSDENGDTLGLSQEKVELLIAT